MSKKVAEIIVEVLEQAGGQTLLRHRRRHHESDRRISRQELD
jgi:hypothetical protein